MKTIFNTKYGKKKRLHTKAYTFETGQQRKRPFAIQRNRFAHNSIMFVTLTLPIQIKGKTHFD